jgi:hypothetical protein
MRQESAREAKAATRLLQSQGVLPRSTGVHRLTLARMLAAAANMQLCGRPVLGQQGGRGIPIVPLVTFVGRD